MVEAAGGFDSSTLIQLLLAVFGASGVLGALVALFKLKPDVNSAAVTQAQGAMTTMKDLNDELNEALTRLREENKAVRTENAELRMHNAELLAEMAQLQRSRRG